VREEGFSESWLQVWENVDDEPETDSAYDSDHSSTESSMARSPSNTLVANLCQLMMVWSQKKQTPTLLFFLAQNYLTI